MVVEMSEFLQVAHSQVLHSDLAFQMLAVRLILSAVSLVKYREVGVGVLQSTQHGTTQVHPTER